MGLFSWICKAKDNEGKNRAMRLTSKLVTIDGPSYKQVVEHLKDIKHGGDFIELSHIDNRDDLNILKASNQEGDNYTIDYFAADKGKVNYRLRDVDVEQAMCFFRDFIEQHKLIDFDLQNNEFEIIN